MSHLLGVHHGEAGTPVSEPLDARQSRNTDGGGYAYSVTDFERLDRFLITGSSGGTFYASELDVTKENTDFIRGLVQSDDELGLRVAKRAVEVSVRALAPKQDSALFVLALCAGLGGPKTRQYAMLSINKVCRTGGTFLQFFAYAEQFRGLGRGYTHALRNWYNDRSIDSLAYQVVKYQHRFGKSHKLVLGLTRPDPKRGDDVTPLFLDRRAALYRWIVGKDVEINKLPDIAHGFEIAKQCAAAIPAVRAEIIRRYHLTSEMIPSEWQTDPVVWGALLPEMPMLAMVRNLATMTKVGLLKPNSGAEEIVLQHLSSMDRITRSRIHPMQILFALRTYASGESERGSSTWIPCPNIVDGLEAAFYASFRNVVPTNKRILLAVDKSGSMVMGGSTDRSMQLYTPWSTAVAFALATHFAEVPGTCDFSVFDDRFGYVPVEKGQAIDSITRYVAARGWGGSTNIGLPITEALNSGKLYDAIVIFTDNEVNAGIHPAQAMKTYRTRTGMREAKIIVCGITATRFSVIDPSDYYALNIAGFSAETPQVISSFIRGAE